MSSILRIGTPTLPAPLFDPAAERALGGLSPISSMLLIGDRGVSGEGVRPSLVELVEPLCLLVVFPSSKAKTSLASWSKTDSNDIGYDMIVVGLLNVYPEDAWQMYGLGRLPELVGATLGSGYISLQ